MSSSQGNNNAEDFSNSEYAQEEAKRKREEAEIRDKLEKVQKAVHSKSAEMEFQKKALIAIMYKAPPGLDKVRPLVFVCL